ncbi:MAG: S-adenosyl-methyltransferase [Flavobacteriaceae bacterium]|nr:S-adenosyl-methyltransferase [Flavobacteriaceae bacterium]|tara:strand:- start:28038 stop:28349 length:312 start_codon:yes stop_codon:yes gene_type:complete
MKKIISILNIDFLIKQDSFRNWRMIFFISILALVMISSGHSADKKIFLIASLNSKIKALKSQFVENKTKLINLKKETNIIKKLGYKGIRPSSKPPVKIIVQSK